MSGVCTKFVGFAHQVCGVCSGSPENHWVTQLATKQRPKTRRGDAATQTGSTAQEGRSDRLAGLTARGGGAV
jgi:hypothetical protein